MVLCLSDSQRPGQRKVSLALCFIMLLCRDGKERSHNVDIDKFPNCFQLAEVKKNDRSLMIKIEHVSNLITH